MWPQDASVRPLSNSLQLTKDAVIYLTLLQPSILIRIAGGREAGREGGGRNSLIRLRPSLSIAPRLSQLSLVICTGSEQWGCGLGTQECALGPPRPQSLTPNWPVNPI